MSDHWPSIRGEGEDWIAVPSVESRKHPGDPQDCPICNPDAISDPYREFERARREAWVAVRSAAERRLEPVIIGLTRLIEKVSGAR